MGFDRIFAISSTLAKDPREPGYIYEGIVVNGSWNPNTGTIKITEGGSYSQFPDSGSSFLPIEATLMTPSVGQCAPPRGGEQVCYTKAQGSWIAWFDNCFQQVVPAQAGEWWQLHFNAAGNVDAYIKLTNDGPTTGDGLAGFRALVGALFSLMTTNGLKIVARDDLAQVGVGDDPANMSSPQAVIRQKDLVAFAATLQTWANENFQSGTAAAPEPTAPAGSTTVLAKD